MQFHQADFSAKRDTNRPFILIPCEAITMNVKRWRWLLLSLLGLIVLAALGFVAWAEIIPPPEPTARGALPGVVLWGSYPQASDDLSGSALAVVSISGTRDGLSTPAKIDASRPLLPPDTRWVVIDGGNHSQFGWYGPQGGDNPAGIDHA